MTQVSIEDLLKRSGSLYRLTVAASRRAKELSEGAPKLIKTDLKKVTAIALEEMRVGKVVCGPLEAEDKSASGSKKRTGAKKKKS